MPTASPGKPQRTRPNTRARAAKLREAQRRREARRRLLLAGGSVLAVVVVLAGLVLLKLTTSHKKKNTAAASTTAAASVVHQVTTVPASAFAVVGQGTATPLPSRISGTPLTAGGKPSVLYIGAEYCPFCATERWPMVVALSRFGSWTNLGATTSASNDVYPNTPTFSFHGATYTSRYLSFTGVETRSNKVQGSTYAPLDTLTAEQNAIGQKYNPQGNIPFIDFGNRYQISGATYKPELLQGKTMAEIADAAVDPSTPIGKGILGAANTITAAVCKLTNNAPSAVCGSPVITGLGQQLDAK